MKLSFVSLFSNLIEFYFSDSILSRARKNNLFSLNFINPRDFSKDIHKKVDDYKIGGGAGLLMQIQPLFDSLEFIKKQDSKAHFIFLNPCAKTFTQKDAKRLSKKEHIVFVCGRYEGIDERVIELFANEIFSVSDVILTGGELAALVLSDAILRNVDEVLGNEKSLEEESFEDNLLEAPAFAKPFDFDTSKKAKIFNPPSVFLKGNHAKIADLKYILASCKTKFFRPDLFLEHERKK
ncbi:MULTISPECIES: tRNA (guanosine(37)-N1)-methyltransferase TrmD [unclassified Campylobacter]|uniref:tRNA (guanosine(37)-N1)-methyltransferase TrmD n=1 Tax=unclassified Campylobacter TaxID=2593542 RepID=UPI001237E977|nr:MULTISPECIES: tRNA (guanosine(37)-N1)-methyltransferase TrmD [unclassified Campylobacter]KAA6224750.1 tRNA (guanosine(37)-N1)-methyltransferase TrmD [Campylobacter sp. LR185c]KAA6225747.1 tRNA (guanosine(37)-N1)-methyltransferase TrmD [Campylobacter sp. LR286c]KAA6225868.1 tRNA (guanosine(37)-N1)-methyltransferase TrmD [Campylobacter sp. LR196d]KAA6229720.1 tRNA (guanosine(37)-N1)-methyltransferase TrmD [Campylobacter sp. LR291e]KAA6230034.1 tRNA (guanosine(37)-N1)-methyltransferase TrmD [C